MNIAIIAKTLTIADTVPVQTAAIFNMRGISVVKNNPKSHTQMAAEESSIVEKNIGLNLMDKKSAVIQANTKTTMLLFIKHI